MSESEASASDFLRHALATVAYRGGKAVRDVPPNFASFCAGETSRSAGEILAHIGDLLDWAVALADGQHVWRPQPADAWDDGVRRFFDGIARLDSRLTDSAPLGFPAEKLFQGPLADALTHIGQIGLLRRLAGAPVRGENYFKADIVAGRVGPQQSPPKREFD